jgi:hypothetical protein
MKKVGLITILFFVLTSLHGYAQSDSGFLAHAVVALQKYSAINPVEKVYLHLDRDGYMPGDTVWFKAYTVIGQKHELSTLSGALYVTLINAKDSVLQKVTLNVASGLTWGDMALPADMKPGNYHVVAYTNWMRNAGPQYFFDRTITVNELLTRVATKKRAKGGTPAVQFFPEGGALVNGLRSKVAVKSITADGLGADVAGVIIDNDGNEVATFNTQHLGMGVFAITPVAGKTYKAKLTAKDGKPFTIDLPAAYNNGFTIAINNSLPDSLGIRVAAAGALLKTGQNTSYYLLAQSGDRVYYTAAFKLSAQSFDAVIDKKRFPTGITQFTLFAANGEPLNERVVFIQHNDTLKLNINAGGNTFAPREKMKILLDAKSAVGTNITGSFSASVVNESFAPVNDLSLSTIINNLLLTADLKGYIEQAGYYFNQVNSKTLADLDVLMLTQGYRRFEWKQVLSGKDSLPAFEPERSLQISGYVKTSGGKPLPGSKVSLLTTTGGLFMLDTLTNQNGRFSFNLIPDESLKYVIQARTAKDKKNVMLVLDTLSAYKVAAFHEPSFNQDTVKELSNYQKQVSQQLKISLDKRVIQIKEVVIKDKQDEPKDLFAHADQPDQVITNFPEESAIGLKAFLANNLRNVVLMDPGRTGINQFYSTRAMARDIKHAQPLMVKLDGAVVTPEIFDSILLTEIERAELITTTGKMDMVTGAKEALYLITRKKRNTTKGATPDVVTYQSNGFYKAREFYSPVYNKINESSTKPDLRTTIYWNPAIVTDNGKASFEYFNADTKGTYRVTIEGIDIDGNLGRQVYTYMVQ